MKFLVNMALSIDLATWPRSIGHDAVHASELGLHRSPDSEIMERAKAEDRTVITADLDYPRLLALSRAAEPSLVMFRDGNWTDREVVRRMSEVLAVLSEAELLQSIVTVERERIRRRRLPLS
jgi:predicted nuclease of predicted toxin-antitoxin system